MTTTLQPQLWIRSPEIVSARRQEEAGGGSEVQAFKALDAFLDLTGPSSRRLGAIQDLDEGGLHLFTQHLQELTRLGVVGTETLEVNGQRRTVFVETAYADARLRDAPRYRGIDVRG